MSPYPVWEDGGLHSPKSQIALEEEPLLQCLIPLAGNVDI